MKFIEASSIRNIEEARWDAVTGDVLSMTHRWLRVMETHWSHCQPHYVLLEDEQGPCVALVADLYASFKNLGLAGWLRQRLSLALRPPFSSMCGVMIRPGVSLDAVLPDVGAFLNQWCRRESRLLTTVSNILAPDVSGWQQAGFLTVSQPPVSFLELPDSYDEYLDSLRPRDRHELRRAYKRGEKFDLQFEIGPLADDGEQIYALLCDVFAQHGTPRAAMPFTAQFLTALNDELPGDVLFLRGYAAGELAGVSLCLRNGTTLWAPMVGLKYEIARPSYLYFLLQDERIHWCLEHGIQRIFLGKTNAREKQRHGFRAEERWFGYRASLSPVNRLLALVTPLVQRLVQQQMKAG